MKKKKKIFYSTLSLLLIASIINLSFNVNGDKIILKAGTPVFLETISNISSENSAVGQTINLRVINDVKKEGHILIKSGTMARGQIINKKERKMFGQPGELVIEIKSVEAVDGQFVPLTGGNVYREGEDKTFLSVGLGVFVCILFLLIKGKDAVIRSGTNVDARVGMDMGIVISN